MSQIYILDDVNIYLISIVYKTWPFRVNPAQQVPSFSFLTSCGRLKDFFQFFSFSFQNQESFVYLDKTNEL